MFTISNCCRFWKANCSEMHKLLGINTYPRNFHNKSKKKAPVIPVNGHQITLQVKNYSSNVKPESMRMWLIDKYGSIDDVMKLQVLDSHNTKTSFLYPSVKHPKDVLVKIHAVSINPIDIRLCQGYGSTLFNFQRSLLFNKAVSSCTIFENVQRSFSKQEFPLVLGRDFSGTVLDVGSEVATIKPGDNVYGAPSVFRSGVLSDLACVDESEVALRPVNLSHIEAASLPYVGLTVAAALQSLVSMPKEPKRVLILGGSGGIGTFAIQYLQAFGYSVTTSCSTEGIGLCESLGAECIDYKLQDVHDTILQMEKFNIVFDTIGSTSPEWASKCLYKGGSYVTLTSPLLDLADKHGPFVGVGKGFLTFVEKSIRNSDINIKWAFFKPDQQALLRITSLVNSGLVKSIVKPENVFSFEDVPNAFWSMSSGHTKGKIVIDVSGKNTENV